MRTAAPSLHSTRRRAGRGAPALAAPAEGGAAPGASACSLDPVPPDAPLPGRAEAR